ncbi:MULTISPECIES: aminomethyl-transferring glycine dehydrogenase [unclassified Pseudomonas]|uniref:aminomethyl-transferring glycine dehydrogenase n=1 Tax=unclassified Pseudomonas TaxID=196821 RepID=UPI0002A32C2E|nr:MULTISPECIES: aminomethyl-transferring glycine dehydrogenase [unclassified Pseudomonas]MBB1606585.1 glycine dehydrogenase (aminomethyl-transferring) [Pseudomonas sp. UMC76]MBB1640642.1 glycine dehydrogenase (aminomethyl-transferring) [Pseudomonas sp. UME83]NTX88225.1 aminomethyl-transferring glycine dehydrogenase [Pseudomonas sp. UMA643]NTY18798.1 aminomethyl-transferring glycine dehydrogenase [Pseudomonas sp. UMC3103]NTY23898.1 aminomethyl-transferring glycine dehydrogenase [Pseudomonas sp
MSKVQLSTRNEFIARHIGPREADTQAMLELVGYASLDALTDSVIPNSIKGTSVLDGSAGQGEAQALADLRAIAAQNQLLRNHIGQGYYPCHTPAPILRNLLENPAWYTAYTPYQPEISQGRLEALLNFQTLIGDLTGMQIANASLLDEATAAAEAMTFCKRLSKNKAAQAFFASAHCHPQTLDVLRTRAEPLGIEVVVGDEAALQDFSAYFGVLLQYPASTGAVIDYRELIERAHAAGTLVAVAADLLALTLLTPPGEFGADVVLGSAQRFGVPLGFGGPHAAYFATRDAFKRDMPGRLVGISIDRFGNPALRLAMQTREQHIRREKATSNICTAQVLLANIASMYAVYHGPQGLSDIARRVHRLTAILAAGLAQLGHKVEQEYFFDTLSVATARPAAEVHAAAQAAGINLRVIDDGRVGVSLDETCEQAAVEALWAVFAAGQTLPDFAALAASVGDQLPQALLRTSAFLRHEVFNRYHSETELMRYLRRLADKDLALDRSMIPLGSCTMKLNAASEMIPITWAEFGNLHPFAPAEQAAGYRAMTAELEAMLCAATGYDAVSLQPNAGSQGEYAGLLAIRAYHASRGEGHRDICLIPSSAHGTNPATAQMAGLRVVVTACDARGNVDLADLKAKAEEHRERLAAIMITYPSTHGVFEEAVRDICAIVHDNGGQVYIDGANMNAMVGLCAPGRFGGDVSHLNLHKTFCIPHGGGGPGVGPIGVKAHLAPFLPGHGEQLERKQGAVSAAPFGSASILPITWMYIRMMGGQGLKRASQAAILGANYIARRLEEHYPVLYTGENGLVAHECILDLRPLKETSGINVDDVAKRLIDFGFHAPTMSFPVAGTLMVEPTESESKEELDRFCDAMIRIREEIRAVERGELDKDDNPLKNAPHTAAELVGEWSHPYSREQAVYPLASLVDGKYWPPVGRVDNVYGDRNLACSCPSIADYQDA